VTDRDPEPASLTGRFARRFWQPPRAHGEVIADRTVTSLELFHDLVYVVVISRASHTLAGDVSWHGLGGFAVVFAMIWIAWLNGTLYLDLHGREDGRTRVFVFVQMLLLALLAVFTADAAGAPGRRFAIVYAAFMAVLTWLWYSVRRRDDPEYAAITGRYLTGMVASVIVVGASAALPPTPRLLVWTGYAVAWLLWTGVVFVSIERTAGADRVVGLGRSASLLERFGLFVIIVLGEVVVGVVTGISETDRDLVSILTGSLGLMIGFGCWWTYFDFVAERSPRDGRGSFTLWVIGHLPATMAITASGAAMVSLIGNAGDDRAPEATAWLLTGSVAGVFVALFAIVLSLEDRRRLRTVYDPLSVALAVGALAAVLVGWWRPSPWLLVLSLVFVFSAVWLFGVSRWLRLDDPDAAKPMSSSGS
jgi:low temperature requirement protein LtrA